MRTPLAKKLISASGSWKNFSIIAFIVLILVNTFFGVGCLTYSNGIFSELSIILAILFFTLAFFCLVFGLPFSFYSAYALEALGKILLSAEDPKLPARPNLSQYNERGKNNTDEDFVLITGNGSEKAGSDRIFCTECGNEIDENINFCPKCGTQK